MRSTSLAAFVSRQSGLSQARASKPSQSFSPSTTFGRRDVGALAKAVRKRSAISESGHQCRSLDRLYLNAYIPELQRPESVKRFLERERTPVLRAIGVEAADRLG
jgi:hypothetical protein